MKGLKTLSTLILMFGFFCAPLIYAAEVSDASIIKDIQTKLTSDPITASLNINVNSNAGIVTLAGTVKTDAEASRAIELAESTPGVSDTNVTNLLVEKSNQPIADTVITAKIKGTFIREKLFGNENDIAVMGVNVETTNGTVTLSGAVDSQSKIDHAIQLARSIDGVKEVESKLIVKPKA